MIFISKEKLDSKTMNYSNSYAYFLHRFFYTTVISLLLWTIGRGQPAILFLVTNRKVSKNCFCCQVTALYPFWPNKSSFDSLRHNERRELLFGQKGYNAVPWQPKQFFENFPIRHQKKYRRLTSTYGWTTYCNILSKWLKICRLLKKINLMCVMLWTIRSGQ